MSADFLLKIRWQEGHPVFSNLLLALSSHPNHFEGNKKVCKAKTQIHTHLMKTSDWDFELDFFGMENNTNGCQHIASRKQLFFVDFP